MKIEIFAFVNATESFMQDTINDWFKDHPDIKIKFITQSEAASTEDAYITFAFFYIEDIMKGGQED